MGCATRNRSVGSKPLGSYIDLTSRSSPGVSPGNAARLFYDGTFLQLSLGGAAFGQVFNAQQSNIYNTGLGAITHLQGPPDGSFLIGGGIPAAAGIGQPLVLAGGLANGAANAGGTILFKVAAAGSGTTLATAMRINTTLNIGVGTTSDDTSQFQILAGAGATSGAALKLASTSSVGDSTSTPVIIANTVQVYVVTGILPNSVGVNGDIAIDKNGAKGSFRPSLYQRQAGAWVAIA